MKLSLHLLAATLISFTGATYGASYSVNILPGPNFIANQLNTGSNTIAQVLPNVPPGSSFLKFNNAQQKFDPVVAGFVDGAGWFPGDVQLKPGEGGVLISESAFVLQFNGDPVIPVLPLPLGAGVALVARQTNAPGNFQNIVGVNPIPGEQVLKFFPNGSELVTNTFTFTSQGVWDPREPTTAVGESVFVILLRNINAGITATALTNQTVCVGQSAAFSTTASGAGPFQYAWFKDGDPIEENGTGSSYTIDSASPSDSGTYCVVVTSDSNSVTNCATLTVKLATTATGPFRVSFADTASIAINDSAPAVPYPATINVQNVSEVVRRVTVQLNSFTHSFPADVDVLLVAPNGTKVMLMSSAGGGEPVANVRLEFSDNAVTAVPEVAALTSGTFRPANYSFGAGEGTGLDLEPPAPPGPYSTGLASFAGISPNGVWRLYVQDHAFEDQGFISEGWVLTFETDRTVCAGANVTFNAAASGTGPFTYQWIKDGANIAGATGSNYAINGTTSADGGNYCVVVSGACGSMTNCARLATTTTISATGPTNQNVCSGGSATFSTTPLGSGPFTFQWLRNGANIAGANGSSFTINSAAATDAGTYCVIITSGCGGLTNCASLTVSPSVTASALSLLPMPPSFSFSNSSPITLPDSDRANPFPATINVQNVAESVGRVSVTLVGLSHLFPDDVDVLLVAPNGTKVMLMSDAGGGTAVSNLRLNFSDSAGAVIPDETALSSGTFRPANHGSSESLPNPAPAAPYATSLSSFVGLPANGVWSLYVQDDASPDSGSISGGWILTIEAEQKVCAGTTVTFSTPASDVGPVTYQWTKNGANISGANTNSYTINSATPSDAGSYCVIVTGPCNSVINCATLSVNAPTTATGPVNQSVCFGASATFNTTAAGTGPFTYQWSKGGNDIAGANGSSYTINAVTPADAGTYCVIVSGACGSVTNCATLALNSLTTASPLTALVRTAGSSATFSTTAAGGAPFTYQWTRNGAVIPGANGSSFSVNSVGAADAGTYCVIVTGGCNSVTNCTTLTFLLSPSITSQPSSLTVTNGDGATFSVSATGAAPLSYQWRFNGANLPGETGPSLTINNTTLANAGAYTAVVSNSAGSVTSVVANLTVILSRDLKVEVATSPASPLVGGTLTYAITVFANGSNGTNVRLTNEFSGSAIIISGAVSTQGTCSVSNGVVTCDLGNFPQAVPVNVTINVIPQVTGTVTSRTSVGSQTLDPNPSNNVVLATTSVFRIGPPVITLQPLDQSVLAGIDVTLRVAAGPLPLSYQWRRNGVNLPGQTNDTLILQGLSPADGSGYSVVVANQFDAVNSRVAIVSIASPALPFSDNFETAGLITAASGAGSGNNAGATTQPGEPLHAGKRGGRSVWINWRAPQDGIVTFFTDGSTFDTLLAAYVGQSVGNLGQLDANDDNGNFNASRITFRAVAGSVYHIAIDGFFGAEGGIVLSWSLEPTADAPPFIVTQPSNQVVALGTRVQFQVEAIAPGGAGLPQYQWFFDGQPIPQANQPTLIILAATADQVGTYRVRVTANNRFVESRDAFLQIFQGNASDAGFASGKFGDVVADAQSGVAFALKSAHAKAVARGFTASQIFSTLGSSTEPGEPNHCGVIGGASFWLAYQAPANGTLLMNTDGSTFDTVLAIYTGPGDDFATLVPVACDNNSGADGRDSKTSFPATAGTIYWIAVDGVGGVTGKVTINWNLLVPLELRSPTNTGNGIRFTVVGSTNGNYTVQTSTDLTNWQNLFTTNSATGLFNFTHTNSPSVPKRFYRARYEP